MDLKEFDRTLADLRLKLGKLARNVAELTGQRDFAAIRGKLKQNGGFVGRTAAAAATLSASADELITGAALLGDALSRASAARERSTAFGGLLIHDGAVKEAVATLQGPSIKMSLKSVPIMARGAFDDAQESVDLSPTAMLELLSDAFRATRDALTAMTQAAQATFDGLETARASLRATAAVPDASAGGDLALSDLVDVISLLAVSDPIGAWERLNAELLLPIAAASDAAIALRALQVAARAELAKARAAMAMVSDMNTAAEQALVALAAKVSDAGIAAVDIAKARELPGWLDRIERNLEAGKLQAFGVGLARWSELLSAVRQEREETLGAAAAAMARRDDMRGRFGALDAKRAAMEARSGPVAEAAETAGRLRQVLFGAITPLRETEKLVLHYEALLRASKA